MTNNAGHDKNSIYSRMNSGNSQHLRTRVRGARFSLKSEQVVAFKDIETSTGAIITPFACERESMLLLLRNGMLWEDIS